MKKIFIFIIAGLLTTTVFSQINHGDWVDDYEKVLKKAKKEKKKILIFFTGSDWCGPCRMLVDDFFDTKKFKNLAEENFILYEADFPRNRNKAQLSQEKRKKNYYLSGLYDVNSYPTVLVLDSRGREVLGERKGYNLMRDASYHFRFLEKIVK